MKLLIEHGWVVPVEGDVEVIQDGGVAVVDDRIAAVGTAEEARAAVPDPDVVLDASGKAVLPGLVNTHTHLVGSLNKGITEDFQSTSGGLFKLALPMHEHHVRHEDVYWAAMVHGLEMLKTGTTTINETWWFQDEAGRCVSDLGLRAVLAPMIRECSFDQLAPTNDERVWDPKLADSTLEEAQRIIGEWHGAAGGRITCRVAPFSPDTCSEPLLGRCRDLAEREGLGYHVHLSQIPGENEFVRKAYGRGSVELMRDLGFLSDRFVGAHCVFMTDEEVDMMAESGAHLSHTAYLVAKRAYFPPMPRAYERHVHVALGSDWCSNDLFQTMKTAITLARHQSGDVHVLNGRGALRFATMGGAEALGMASEIGSLTPGKKADVITIDLTTPWCNPIRKDNLVTNIVYNASGADVCDAIVDGKVVMTDRVVKTVDEGEALREGQAVADRVWDRAAALLA